MTEGTKTDIGTTITLFLNEDVLEFCNEYRAREVIKKYCSFMPTEIYLSRENTTETQTIKASEKLDTDVVIEEIKPEKEEDEKAEGIDIEPKAEITYDDFAKLQFQIGEIVKCEAVPKCKTSLCSQVKIGTKTPRS